MSNIPAFPIKDFPYQETHDGLSMRDYFAAKAMQGMLSNPKLHQHIIKEGGAFGGWIESSAYGWADAMMKAREA
jgi:hypothetical protein